MPPPHPPSTATTVAGRPRRRARGPSVAVARGGRRVQDRRGRAIGVARGGRRVQDHRGRAIGVARGGRRVQDRRGGAIDVARGGRRAEAGQAAVEFVALLPLVVVVLALGWQIVLLGHAAWSVHAAARAAARAHAVGGDELRAARAVLPSSLDSRVRLVPDDDAASVVLRLRAPLLLPGVPEPALTARSTFASQT